jgi:hypothetical protein
MVERQKRTKIITTTLICLAAISLTAFNYYQHRQIQLATGKISPGSETSPDRYIQSGQSDSQTISENATPSPVSQISPIIPETAKRTSLGIRPGTR